MEHVHPFLSQIERSFGLGLDVDQLSRWVAAAEVETAYGCDMNLIFEGEPVNMKFSACIDDIDAPDLYFCITSERLAKGIDAEMEKFCEANGL